jgi:hypothetical protein
MGQQKSANTKRDQWAVWKAVELAVELIHSEELDQAGPELLVLEALDAGEWDDIVVHAGTAGGGKQTTRWQLKRQNEPLGEDAFSSLLVDLKAQLQSCGAGDCFCFATPHAATLELKSGATMAFHVLRDICDAARTPGVNADTLVNKGTVKAKAWCKYVRGSCSATSSDEVALSLARLHIHEIGLEEDIRNRATKQLQTIYRNAEDLTDRLFNYIVQKSDGRFEITYGVLAVEILQRFGRRDATRAPWLRATRRRAYDSWHLGGPLQSGEVVASTWPTEVTPATIRVDATPQSSGDEAEAALVRLVAHRSHNVNAEVENPEDWNRYIRLRTGGTFGFAANNRGVALRPVPDNLRPPSSNTIPPKELADSLQSEMDLHLWDGLRTQMNLALADPAQLGWTFEAALLGAMAGLWRSWEQGLDVDAVLRAHFLGLCLATNEEWSRSEFDKRMRLGEKALSHLTSGLLLALAIGVATNDDDVQLRPSMEDGANFLIGDAPAHLLTLAFASMPGSTAGLKITDAAAHFLIEEPGCTLISEAEADPEALLATAEGQAVPYNVARASQADYQSAYSPKPVLTNEVDLRRALRGGRDALGAFLAGRFAKFADDHWAFLKEAVERPIDVESSQ